MSNEAFFSLTGGMHAIRLVVTQTSGRMGLARHQLRFDAEVTARDTIAEGAELTLAGSLSLQTGEYIGLIAPATAFHVPREHTNLVFTADLDPGQLAALEQLRPEAGVSFRLDIEGVAITTAGRDRVGATISDYSIAQSSWLSILEQMGYGRTLILELPLPNPSTQVTLARSLDFLQSARRAFAMHLDQQAGLECRNALTALRDQMDDEGQGLTYADLQASIKSVRKDELPKAARFQLVRDATKAAADLAAHPEVDHLDRGDAAALIAIVAALLHQELRRRTTQAPMSA